jgi:hypothetical protein
VSVCLTLSVSLSLSLFSITIKTFARNRYISLDHPDHPVVGVVGRVDEGAPFAVHGGNVPVNQDMESNKYEADFSFS